MFIFVCALVYFGYDYYSFTSTTDSPLAQKKAVLSSKIAEGTKIKAKINDAKEFYRTFEKKRVALRDLTIQLDSLKSTLSDRVEMSVFIKTVVQEAEKVGLTVLSIKPLGQEKGNFYLQQSFDLTFSGVYVQFMLFLDHIANLERIMRIENVELKRIGKPTDAYVEISGKIQVRSYSYLGTKADDLAKELNNSAADKPNTIPKPVAPGGKS